MKKLFLKYKDIISYLFFGVCTTAVNIIAYWFCSYAMHLSTIPATAIAWILAVAFAYVTNRKWVFNSKAKGAKAIAREIASFVACRLLTGILDVAIMYIFVDRLNCPDLLIKIISNIIVIVVNYIASKLFIFNEKQNSAFFKKGLIFTAVAAIALSLAMLSDWAPFRHRDGFCDTGVYKYVGQVIRDGGMPYKDVFDHKGPLMYILQAVSGYVDEYRGEWILEFLAITISAFAIYAIARRLGCKPLKAILALVIVFTPLYSFYTLSDNGHVGGCCCLLALPLATLSALIFTKYLQTKKIKNISVFLCGLMCGGALMLRPNLVAVWAAFGIIILVDCIREKRIRELWRFVGLFFLGVVALIVPILIWLAANGALGDFFEQYIEFNLYYSNYYGGGIPSKIREFFYLMNFAVVPFSVIYMIYRLVAHRTKLDIYFAIMYAACIFMAILPGNDFPHYGSIIIPGMIYPCAMLCASLPERKGKKYSESDARTMVVALAIIAIAICPTWVEIFRKDISSFQARTTTTNRNDPLTVQLTEQIHKYTEPDDEIVVYDTYPYPTLYNHSGRRSATRFMFFTESVESFKNNHEEYYSTLEEKKPKIVIMWSHDLAHKESMKEFLSHNNYTAVWPEQFEGKTADDEFDPYIRVVFYRPAD